VQVGAMPSCHDSSRGGKTNLDGQEYAMPKFSAILPTPETTGDFDEMCLAAGASAALVRSIKPAREVVLSMAMEAEQILARLEDRQHERPPALAAPVPAT
jgi:hypothetical protein